MAPSAYKRAAVVGMLLFGSVVLMFCGETTKYKGDIVPEKYAILAGRRIFIDPGHGGLGERDQFRIGPGGLREEAVNLRVALILADMLGRAGAEVRLSRRRDRDVPLAERVAMAREFAPELLVSVHHNGTHRRMEGVNFPSVFIWGGTPVNPQGGDFARLLLGEFQKITGVPGAVFSDFSVYPETGTMILRETRDICAGAIGECGFFSDGGFSMRLADIGFNRLEAEAYFLAIADFFRNGIPAAEVRISSPTVSNEYASGLIDEKKPLLGLALSGGLRTDEPVIREISATLDGVAVSVKKARNSLYMVDYGRELYPGTHRLRFSFVNARGRHSMIFGCDLTTVIRAGDYTRCVSKGKMKLRDRRTARDGLMMLLAAHSIARTQPDADEILYRIARGFSLIGDVENSDYCFSKLYHFYPDSPLRDKAPVRVKGHRFQVEHLGKKVEIKYDPALAAIVMSKPNP